MDDKELDITLSKIRETLVKKNHDYGPRNIQKFGEKGVIVRASDKIERIFQLVWEKVTQEVDSENVDDTWLDLAGYAIIGYMVRHGKW